MAENAAAAGFLDIAPSVLPVGRGSDYFLNYAVAQIFQHLDYPARDNIALCGRVLFLQDYEPFKCVKDSKNNFLNKIARKNINDYKIQFASEILARHEYNFQRSEQFLAQYKYLQSELKRISDNKILINDDIYKDIFKRISILVAEAENKALREGYNHARNTRYKLYDDEIYNDFVKDRVLKGEGEIDWKNLKERLENDR